MQRDKELNFNIMYFGDAELIQQLNHGKPAPRVLAQQPRYENPNVERYRSPRTACNFRVGVTNKPEDLKQADAVIIVIDQMDPDAREKFKLAMENSEGMQRRIILYTDFNKMKMNPDGVKYFDEYKDIPRDKIDTRIHLSNMSSMDLGNANIQTITQTAILLSQDVASNLNTLPKPKQAPQPEPGSHVSNGGMFAKRTTPDEMAQLHQRLDLLAAKYKELTNVFTRGKKDKLDDLITHCKTLNSAGAIVQSLETEVILAMGGRTKEEYIQFLNDPKQKNDHHMMRLIVEFLKEKQPHSEYKNLIVPQSYEKAQEKIDHKIQRQHK